MSQTEPAGQSRLHTGTVSVNSTLPSPVARITGSPEAGTPVMQTASLAALDLPLLAGHLADCSQPSEARRSLRSPRERLLTGC
jgi:hypothetical protein